MDPSTPVQDGELGRPASLPSLFVYSLPLLLIQQGPGLVGRGADSPGPSFFLGRSSYYPGQAGAPKLGKALDIHGQCFQRTVHATPSH